jgi:hypothetical protein
MFRKAFIFSLTLFLLSACKPKASVIPTNNIAASVAGTLTALPQPTPLPTYTPFPTFTPDSPPLEGLFCEYQFCIGHPVDIALFDARDPKEPSQYSDGMLAAYRADLFNLVIWQYNHGTDDPQFMLDLVMDANVDTRVGTLDVGLLGDLTTFYSPITNTTSIPAGGVAAWVCGDRAFGWKIYTPSEEIAKILFGEALGKFRCIP